MNRSIRKSLIFITACAMILMLCGCTKKTEPAAEDKPVVQQTETAETPAESAETETEKPAEAAPGHGDQAGEGPSAYEFISGGVLISMNQDTSEFIDKLGEPANYAESPSCAFEGIDKIYSYEGWDLYTYPDGDKDRVNSVYFTDESVSTPEGIKIGSTVEEVLKAYPGEHTEKFDVYTYTDGNAQLAIMTTDGSVDAIEYTAVLED